MVFSFFRLLRFRFPRLCALRAGYCGFAAITHALRALLRQRRHHLAIVDTTAATAAITSRTNDTAKVLLFSGVFFNSEGVRINDKKIVLLSPKNRKHHESVRLSMPSGAYGPWKSGLYATYFL
jgi:hypothetical protein